MTALKNATAHGEACGKVILLGEHMVVFGAPALAAGIERGARASATRLPDGGRSSLHLGARDIDADATSEDDLARAFAALLAERDPIGAIYVDAESELPPGGGLGSSAALGVAIARAVTRLVERDEADVIAQATAWERVFHGNPSGIDISAASLVGGGCIRFTREEGARRVDLRAPLWLCVGWSGEASSTRAMVEGVARLRARKPDLVERSIAGSTALVENAALALKAGDEVSLGKLMDLAQMLLSGLFVSTEAIERLCTSARGAGALGAKLTGAGGGGSVIALIPRSDDGGPDTRVADAVLSAWREAGFGGFLTRVGASHAARSEEE